MGLQAGTARIGQADWGVAFERGVVDAARKRDVTVAELVLAYRKFAADLPPLNSTASRERIWGRSKPREATNATRKEGTG